MADFSEETKERRPGEVTPADKLPVLVKSQVDALVGGFHDVCDDEVPEGAILDGWNIRTLAHTIEADLALLEKAERQLTLICHPERDVCWCGSCEANRPLRDEIRKRLGMPIWRAAPI